MKGSLGRAPLLRGEQPGGGALVEELNGWPSARAETPESGTSELPLATLPSHSFEILNAALGLGPSKLDQCLLNMGPSLWDRPKCSQVLRGADSLTHLHPYIHMHFSIY